MTSPDDFREQVRQQIWDAFDLDSMTEAERAEWDSYGRAHEAHKADLEAHRVRIAAQQQDFADRMTKALAPYGLRVEVEGGQR